MLSFILVLYKEDRKTDALEVFEKRYSRNLGKKEKSRKENANRSFGLCVCKWMYY